ncbi:MAG TPA: hypothetical protein VEZ11_10085, partial [Thermoanaerobaculia bacterium]|nr:hypothetical protein [Thermoanaerobaculia bacterium]
MPKLGREPDQDTDPLARLRAAISAFFAYAPIAAYFYYWDHKQRIRRFFQLSALWILTIALVRLVAEPLIEVVLASSRRTVPDVPSWIQIPLWIAYGGAILYLLIHNYTERKHQISEYILAAKVWEFMERRRRNPREDELVAVVLADFLAVFARFRIAHVSIFRMSEGALIINPSEVWPQETNAGYFISLAPGTGVAGLVHADMKPRYVPRIFFPFNSNRLGMLFPHAVKFEVVLTPNGHFDMVNPRMDVNVFAQPQGHLTFSSFLSVPLRSLPQDASEQECLGVLNFDFLSTDPLDRSDIKAAV